MLHKLVLGYAHWGTNKVTISSMLETIALAFQHGIREIDCAPHYGNGSQETILGVALAALPEEQRVHMRVSTKVGRVIDPNSAATTDNGFTRTTGFGQYFDYSKKGIFESFYQSQLRLGLSKIDCLYLHDPDAITHGAHFNKHYNDFRRDGREAFSELQEKKKIHSVGIGSNDPDICIELIENNGFQVNRVMIAGAYNLLNVTALHKLFPLCLRKKIEVFVAAPFGGGILSEQKGNQFFRYTTANTQLVNRVMQLKEVANDFGIPLNHAAMQFVHMHPQVSKIVVGARTPAELEATLQYATTPLPLDFWDSLSERGLIPKAAIYRDSTHRFSPGM